MSKSAIPLVLGAGLAAFFLSGKKKKASTGKEKLDYLGYVEMTTDPIGDEKLQFDEECSAIVNKINFGKHNDWITNRYFQLLSEGMGDLDQITIQLLKDQSDHCPWENPEKWTDLMAGLYDQLNRAVKAWHEKTGGKGLPL